MKEISAWFVPISVVLIIVFGWIRKVPLFSEFIVGAKEGLKNSAEILPPLIGLIAAVAMLRTSGVLDWLGEAASPLLRAVGIPREVFPMILLRPVSGSGSIAILEELLKNCGPDSFPGRVASVMAASTETTFYTITVYFGAVQIKKHRHTLAAALVADNVCTMVAILTVHLFFK